MANGQTGGITATKFWSSRQAAELYFRLDALIWGKRQVQKTVNEKEWPVKCWAGINQRK